MTDPIDDRLRAYFRTEHFALDPALPRRALNAAWRSNRSRINWRPAIAALAALLVTSLLGTTLVWAAGAPSITDQLLREVGLTRAERAGVQSGHVVAQGTVHGHTIRILAVHADEQHTVMIVDQEAGMGEPESWLLTDDAGRTQPLLETAASAPGPAGAARMQYVVIFGPMSPGAHRLTLTIDHMRIGRWVLTFPVKIESASMWPVRPSAGPLGAFTVTGVSAAGDSDMLLIGVAATIATASVSDIDALTVNVVGPDGRELHAIGPGRMGLAVPGSEGLVLRTTCYFQPAGKGTYRVLIGYRGHRMESTFTLP